MMQSWAASLFQLWAVQGIAQKGLIRALAKSAVCLVNLSANGAKVAGKVPAKDL